MSDQTDRFITLLHPFGLTSEEIRVYLALASKSPQSALAISREIHLARTKVYRILDKLVEKNLVSVQLDDQGKKFVANSYQELGLLVRQKESEVERLRHELPAVFAQIAGIWGKQGEGSKVLYYSGTSGLEQVTWNSLRAKGELRTYEIEQDMDAFIQPKLAEKIREELVEREITTLQLTNKTHILPFTRVALLPNKFWEVRYLNPKELTMRFECLIYNNVFVVYNFKGKDQFCVEIYDEKLAAMQKQLFDFVWSKAKKMKILNDRGEARI